MMNGNTKTIVFDWNSTLLDDVDLTVDSVNAVLSGIGHIPISLDDLRNHHAWPLDLFYKQLGLTDEETNRALTIDRDYFHNHYETHVNDVTLRSGTVELLQHLSAQGVCLLILSNHLIDPICLQLDRFAIRNYFHEVLAYANREVQFKDMTKGERLRQYVGKRKLRPEDAIIIGDTPEEVEIGRDLGLTSVAITGGIVSEQRLREEKPNYLIHELNEFSPILRELGFLS
jgi:phosphoglycolate phosphatase